MISEVEERRRFAWFCHHGLGMTLDETAKVVGRSREQVRQYLRQLDYKICTSWLPHERTRSQMPGWWRRLRDANAFRPSHRWFEPQFRVPRMGAGR